MTHGGRVVGGGCAQQSVQRCVAWTNPADIMSFEVTGSRLRILARGVGYGCVAGAAAGIVVGLGLTTLFPPAAVFIFGIGSVIGMAIGSVLGFGGGLALQGYCVAGRVTVGFARRVAAVSMGVLSAILALAVAADFAFRQHKPVFFRAVAGGWVLSAVVTGAIAAFLAERVVWGKAVMRQRGGCVEDKLGTLQDPSPSSTAGGRSSDRGRKAIVLATVSCLLVLARLLQVHSYTGGEWRLISSSAPPALTLSGERFVRGPTVPVRSGDYATVGHTPGGFIWALNEPGTDLHAITTIYVVTATGTWQYDRTPRP